MRTDPKTVQTLLRHSDVKLTLQFYSHAVGHDRMAAAGKYPLEDIRNTRKIAAVIMAGKYYSRQELDKMLARVAEVARNR